ncbi:MAG: WD40-repeat-containing domain protein [Linnemannia gamsii]|nr:MAG: WD40-repeat-containing domain protein [Linnemannia gamsii]
MASKQQAHGSFSQRNTSASVNSEEPALPAAIRLADTSMELVNASSSTVLPGYPSEDERSRLIEQLYGKLLNGPRIDILSKLPYEIASYILHFVDMPNLAKVASISKTWNNLTKDNAVWKTVYLRQQHWRIRTPSRKSAPNTAATIDPEQDPAQKSGGAGFGIGAGTITKTPLDWKELCRNRKVLEARWSTAPTMKPLAGHTDSVYCIQFDNTKIVTGSRDQTIMFWDFHTLECTDILRGHSQSVLCLQFNEKMMVSGSSDNTIIVWDMETHQPISRLHGHTAGVLDVCFDDQYIISCSKDTTIKVWDVRTMALIKTMTGHRGPVNAVQLHQGLVVSASGDALVKLWDVKSGVCIRDFIGHERGLACVQFDGKTIVSGSNDKTIRIWDVATGICTKILTGHENLVRTLHFDQNRIVSGSYDYTVKVWDMTTGECTLDLDKGHVSWVFDVQFSSSRIISTSQDKKILVWDFAADMDTSLFE